MNELYPLPPGCRVDRVVRIDPEAIRVVVHGRRNHGRCPECGRVSGAVHSRYHRHPADLPPFGRGVRLSLGVRRFYCRNGACPRRTFAERLPGLLAPRARAGGGWPRLRGGGSASRWAARPVRGSRRA